MQEERKEPVSLGSSLCVLGQLILAAAAAFLPRETKIRETESQDKTDTETKCRLAPSSWAQVQPLSHGDLQGVQTAGQRSLLSSLKFKWFWCDGSILYMTLESQSHCIRRLVHEHAWKSQRLRPRSISESHFNTLPRWLCAHESQRTQGDVS